MISSEVGILSHISRLPMLNGDPNIIGHGVWPCHAESFRDEPFEGRSSGCGYSWDESLIGTVGEVLERYGCGFYDLSEATFGTYKELGRPAVHPSEYALFHEKQHEGYNTKRIQPFTENLKLHWFETLDLTDGGTKMCPGEFIYLPFTKDPQWVTVTTSTGLSAHTDYYKAILGGLHEVIERDGFTITWSHAITPPKFHISAEMTAELHQNFPEHYEWHFFDISYDLETPSVFGICFGEAEFGKFVAVGTSTRATYKEAWRKTVKEIGQAVSYFRYLLGEKVDWVPTDDYSKLMSFEDHSVYYNKRPDMWHVFDPWRKPNTNTRMPWDDEPERTPKEEILRLLKMFKSKGYNVLFKDLTTPDVNQLGFYSIRVFVPQLIQMAGAYPFYYFGGKRLYEVPKKLGYDTGGYDSLNKYPHPFP